MNTVGIAAEYNPFTNGHKYHISKCKNSRIIAVMSGNFVQRAEPAFFDKHTRARLAIENGVDLVLELPVSFSVGSAEKFAYGCVYILNALGVCDQMCFGSEHGRIDEIEKTADEVLEITHDELKKELDKGVAFASARAKILENRGVLVPQNPNDILAVEYVKAIKKIGSKIRPITIERKGSYHGAEGEFYGASAIRKMLLLNDLNVKSYIPENVFESFYSLKEKGKAPASLKYAERAILAYLRTTSPQTLSNFYGISEGLEYRIKKAADESTSIEELYEKIKSKRYAMSAVRRAVLCAFLQIEKTDRNPTYIRVLAQNNTGSQILKEAKITSTLPIIHKLSKIAQNDLFAQKEIQTSNLYSLCLPEIQKSFLDLTACNYIKK